MRTGSSDLGSTGCAPKRLDVVALMQTENDYDKEVYNGDIGTIDDVDPNAGELAVSFDGRSIKYGFGELDMLVKRPSVRNC